MQQLLQLFILVPFAGFLISLLFSNKQESPLSATAIAITGVHFIGVLAFIIFWMLSGSPMLDVKHTELYKNHDINIFIDFYFDKVTATFALAGSLLTFMVSVFSKYYLHREEGYKRFFSTLLFFFLGYNIIIFSGNFETLFIGWEILGISSFLLISFYRDRFLPVRNGLKVISIYRLGDICLILAMWMSHHLWHENIVFNKLNDAALVQEHLTEHYGYAVFIALMIFVAAAAKSAQLPFSSWLPRAMEGPTTSSAIFYGSLSVHLGAFLLMRTYPYWETIGAVKWVIIITGLLTSMVATSIARVQPTVKTQIAYSSVAQIGLIFIEIALGFHVLALIHFAGNAFLRTYQLLVSPSVLSYLVHDMFFHFKAKTSSTSTSFNTKVRNSVYMLSVKEWNLDRFMFRYLWSPFKLAGRNLGFLNSGISTVILILIYISGVYGNYNQEQIPEALLEFMPFLFSFIGLILILKVFAERGDAIRAWVSVIAAQLYITLSVSYLNAEFGFNQILIYLSGIAVSAVAGYICLKKIKSIDNNIDLSQYHGYTYEKPGIGFVFLIACLGLIGLPFTPTFIGIDILFSHIHRHQLAVIISTSVSFMFIELSILRIYARVFLGQHKKAYHPIAFKYS